MTLTFDIHNGSCTQLVDCIYQLLYNRLQQFLKKTIVLPFSPYKSMDQIWLCREIGHCHPRVIIWTNLVVIEHPMLHTNIQCHRLFDSREEYFIRFHHIMGIAAILVMSHKPFVLTLILPSHEGSTWNMASIGLAVSRKRSLKMLNLSDLRQRYM